MIIDTDDFARLIWNTIQQELNPETRKILTSMSYDSVEYEQGFIQGLAWASILSVLTKPTVLDEDDSQRVTAALEDEGYFNQEEEQKYKEVIDKLYKPLGLNIFDGTTKSNDEILKEIGASRLEMVKPGNS